MRTALSTGSAPPGSATVTHPGPEAAARRSSKAQKDHKAAMAFAAASEATVKDEDLRRLKNQLQSLGYRAGKSDPTKLFARFDLDYSGRLVSMSPHI